MTWTLRRCAALLNACWLASSVGVFIPEHGTPPAEFVYYVLVVFQLAAPAISILALLRTSHRTVAVLNATFLLGRVSTFILEESRFVEVLSVYLVVLELVLPVISIIVLLSKPQKQRDYPN